MSYIPINSVGDFRRAVRMGTYADGGYPIYVLMADGECICPSCAKKERRQILEAIVEPDRRLCEAWRAVSAGINWEDGELFCAHCNERIPSAYAEPEDTESVA